MGKTWRRSGKEGKGGKPNTMREDEWQRRKKLKVRLEKNLRKKREVKVDE